MDAHATSATVTPARSGLEDQTVDVTPVTSTPTVISTTTHSPAEWTGLVSYFNTHHDQQPAMSVSIDEVFWRLQHDEGIRTQTAAVREALQAAGGDKKAASVAGAKAKLPAITVSGTVTRRAGAEGLIHSNMIQADIDNLPPEEITRVKTLVAQDPSTVVAFVSPTGTGVKVLVHIPAAPEAEDVRDWHAKAFASVERHYRDAYSITIDPAPKNPAALMYLGHDPELGGHGKSAQPLPMSAGLPVEPPSGESAAADFAQWASGAGFHGDLRTLEVLNLAKAAGLNPRELGANKIAIECPWGDEHTTPPNGSDTVLIHHPDTQGIKWSFKCSHGHCAARSLRDFLEKLGPDIVDAHCGQDYKPRNGRPGVELPGDDRPLSEFADELGRILGENGVFLHGGLPVVVRGGEFVLVTPDYFRTWADTVIYTFRSNGRTGIGEPKEVTRSMNAEAAKAVLASPQFAAHLKKISGLAPVRMPTMRESGCIELLPAGYDPETQVYTPSETCDYPKDWSLEQAKQFLEVDLLGEFPFADDGGRSKAVAVAAMLAIYAPHLIDPQAPRPCFIYLANSEGSGKTLLAQIAGAPYGNVAVTSAPKTEEEWQKKILATVMSGTALMILDNAKGHLNSSALEALLSSSKFEGRVLGASKVFRGDVFLTVIITGNGLTVTPDLARRSLFVELFSDAMRAEDRVFRRVLDAPEIRRQQPNILAALWALIRSWDEQGRPEGAVPHASFARWAKVYGGILEAAGYKNPCLRPMIAGMADPDVTDMENMTGRMILDDPFTFDQLANICMDQDLFERATKEREEPDNGLTRKGKSILGNIFKRFNGKIMRPGVRFVLEGTGHGRRFVLRGVNK